MSSFNHSCNASHLALHKATKDGDLQRLQELIDLQTDLSTRNGKGQTALHIACIYGRTAVVKLLLTALTEKRDVMNDVFNTCTKSISVSSDPPLVNSHEVVTARTRAMSEEGKERQMKYRQKTSIEDVLDGMMPTNHQHERVDPDDQVFDVYPDYQPHPELALMRIESVRQLKIRDEITAQINRLSLQLQEHNRSVMEALKELKTRNKQQATSCEVTLDRSSPCEVCPDGGTMVEHIPLVRGVSFKQNLYDLDKKGRNCLYIAAENKQSEIVELFLRMDFQISHKLLNTNFLVEDSDDGVVYTDSPFRSILRNLPELVFLVLNQYGKRAEKNSNRWNFDYSLFLETDSDTGVINGNDISAAPSPTIPNSSYRRGSMMEMRTAIEQHPLMLAYKSDHPKVTQHAVIASLLYNKWCRVRPLHYFILLFYLTFMVLITYFMVNERRHRYGDNIEGPLQNRELHTLILSYTLCGLSCLGMIIEVLQMCILRRMYVENLTQVFLNTLDWFMYVVTMWVVMFPAQAPQASTQWEFGCLCMFISWFNFLLHHPCFSLYLYMIVEVVQQFWRFTCVFVLFLLLFGISFSVLLFNQEPHYTLYGSVIRTWTMMVGDIGYPDIFYPDEQDDKVMYHKVTTFLFVIFLSLGLIITNIWTGFIISRLTTLENNANKRKLQLQLDYILTLEYTLPSCIRKCFVFNDLVKTVTLKKARHPIIPVISSLLGDMMCCLPDSHKSTKEFH